MNQSLSQVLSHFEGDSIDERIEKFRSYQDHKPKYLKKGIPSKNNVVFVLTRHGAGRNGKPKKKKFYGTIDEVIFGKNIATDQADLFYAQLGAGEAVSEDFNGANARQELRNSADTPAKTDQYGDVAGLIAASRKAIDGTYPQTNDGDADNTGSGVDIVSRLTSWTKGDFNASGIVGGIIHNGAGSPIATTELLSHYSVTSFDKTADDTLKGFVNHQMNGV